MVETLVLCAYGTLCALLVGYGLHRTALLFSVGGRTGWRAACERPAPRDAEFGDSSAVPALTVQLPLYNERAVARRAILACAALDWPRSAFELQVLDDSTDETRAIVDQAIAEARAAGSRVAVLRRERREGFKAGALAAGLREARGELIAIFDADFVPPRDFLRRVVPHLADPRVGMVQARWEHSNREESLLTRAQATLIDAHFVVEHTGRSARGAYINFNGTAGAWKRAAIESGGGWQTDTLTEDLDLSYRAQLAGWRFVYVPGVAAPAEIPSELGGYRSQQARWACGSIQVARKLVPRVLRARVRAGIKFEALAHLLGYAGAPFAAAMGLVLPLAQGSARVLRPSGWVTQGLVFTLGTLTVFLVLERAQAWLGRPLRRRLLDVPLAMALGAGISLSQTAAVLRGLKRAPSEFVRTPKRGASSGPLYRPAAWRFAGVELLLALWIAAGAIYHLVGDHGGAGARGMVLFTLPSTAVFAAGFGWVGALGLAERLARRSRRGAGATRREPASAPAPARECA
jgi:hypothetical protein